MRPRLRDPDLPPRVYLKHGAYYYVSPSGQWIGLGKDKGAAIRAAPTVSGTDAGLRLHLTTVALPSAKRNAKAQDRTFLLTEGHVVDLATTNKWRCAITGIRFSLEPAGRGKRRPYAPSIDRIDCAIGYEPGNVRLVCVAMNIALADWGEAVFNKIALHYAGRLLERDYATLPFANAA